MRHKTITDEQLLALLQESDINDRDNDFETDTEESDSGDDLFEENILKIR